MLHNTECFGCFFFKLYLPTFSETEETDALLTGSQKKKNQVGETPSKNVAKSHTTAQIDGLLIYICMPEI